MGRLQGRSGKVEVEQASARTAIVNQASPLQSLGPAGFHPSTYALRL